MAQQGKYSLTLEATKGAATKALDLSANNVLNASWKDGEKVSVFLESAYLGQLTAAVTNDPTKAKLSGTLDPASGIEAGKTLTLLFPRSAWSYYGQKGTLDDIAKNYDYAVAEIAIKSIDGEGNITADAASFVNQQSVYRFNFTSGGNALNVKSFTVSSAKGQLVSSMLYNKDWMSCTGPVDVTPVSAASEFYVALRNDNTTEDDSYSFNAVGSDNAPYVGGSNTVSAANLGNGKYLGTTVSLSPIVLETHGGSSNNVKDIL